MYLITPTLLNAHYYYMRAEEGGREDYLRTLRRESMAPTESMQKGIDLENEIINYCNGEWLTPSSSVVSDLGEICKGGRWQVPVKRSLGEYVLYGRADNVKQDTIFDIKYTTNYEVGKYLHSMQHRIYLYCSGMPKFSYLISDYKEVWREDYFNHSGIEDEIKSAIHSMVSHFEVDKEAGEIFKEKWVSL